MQWKDCVTLFRKNGSNYENKRKKSPREACGRDFFFYIIGISVYIG